MLKTTIHSSRQYRPSTR